MPRRPDESGLFRLSQADAHLNSGNRKPTGRLRFLFSRIDHDRAKSRRRRYSCRRGNSAVRSTARDGHSDPCCLRGVLTYSLSVSLVPSLSEAAARGDMRTIIGGFANRMRLALVAGDALRRPYVYPCRAAYQFSLCRCLRRQLAAADGTSSIVYLFSRPDAGCPAGA